MVHLTLLAFLEHMSAVEPPSGLVQAVFSFLALLDSTVRYMNTPAQVHRFCLLELQLIILLLCQRFLLFSNKSTHLQYQLKLKWLKKCVTANNQLWLAYIFFIAQLQHRFNLAILSIIASPLYLQCVLQWNSGDWELIFLFCPNSKCRRR